MVLMNCVSLFWASALPIFSTPLLPAFTGFQLSVDRDYSGVQFLTLIAQITLTFSLLSLAIYAFNRRDLIFSSS